MSMHVFTLLHCSAFLSFNKRILLYDLVSLGWKQRDDFRVFKTNSIYLDACCLSPQVLFVRFNLSHNYGFNVVYGIHKI